MANGISRASVWEAMRLATSRDGILDLWQLASELADDVESWGEQDFFSDPIETRGAAVPRYFHLIESN